MEGELASENVSHFVTSTSEGSIEGFVVIANAVVSQHHVEGLLGTDGKVAAKTRLEVEAVGHLDLIGAETEIGTQIYGKEG